MEGVIIDYQTTGNCKIDIDFVIKKWNHLWWLSQWNNEFRLIKYVRKDSPMTDIKVTISIDQAYKLIKKLDLICEQSSTFSSASAWRRQIHIDSLNEWRQKKYGSR